MMSLYPMLLEPSLHAKVWGGRRLETQLGKALPADGQPYGEAWELHDTAQVANGALAGRTLAEMLTEYGAALIGARDDFSRGIPLLAKFIDSSDWLSVQVHPSDDQCMQLEGERRGKTEAWYIVAAEPGAQLIIGVQPETTRAELAQALRRHTLKNLLVYATVQPGDVLFIATGTIHALGPGILLYEIQQSSDTTYRLYDWDRPGLDGKPRPLHIEQSLAVMNSATLPDILHTAENRSPEIELVNCPYFRTVLHQLDSAQTSQVEIETGGGFHVLTCLDGAAVIEADGERLDIGRGQTALIPACIERYTLSGAARLLRSSEA